MLCLRIRHAFKVSLKLSKDAAGWVFMACTGWLFISPELYRIALAIMLFFTSRILYGEQSYRRSTGCCSSPDKVRRALTVDDFNFISTLVFPDSCLFGMMSASPLAVSRPAASFICRY